MGPREKEFLATEEFLKYAGISKRTLRRRVADGKLSPIKTRRGLLFHYTQLPNDKAREEFLKDRGLLPETRVESEMPGDLKPWQKTIMLKREALVKEYLAADRDISPGKKGQFQKHFAKMHEMSPQTLRRHLRDYKQGGREALAPLWNPGGSERVITKEMEKFINGAYMRPYGPNAKEVHEELLVTFKDSPRLPTYRTVLAYIHKKWPKGQQLLIRDKEQWDRAHAPYVPRDWSQVDINECWFGDAKQIDVACLFRGKAIYPWYTAFLDAASRKFVGWILTSTPDADAIAQAFVYAAQKHGIPRVVYIDRGKAYKAHKITGEKIKAEGITPFKTPRSDRIAGIFGEMGIEVFWAAPYNAKEKGPIESAFRIFTHRLRGLPGYRGHNTKTRPRKLATEIRSGKLLAFAELSAKIDELILARNARPHPATRRSPDSYFKDFTPVIPSQNLLAFLLMDAHRKKVRASAVIVDETMYRHEDMWRLNGEEVEIRRDPQDLRRAAIIYSGEVFCIAPEVQVGDYASPLTKGNVKEFRQITRKTRQFRKQIIEQGGYIEDPLKLAVHLSEKGRKIEVAPRAPKAKVVSFHKKERLAKEVAEGLKEAPTKAESRGRGKMARISKNDRHEQILDALFGD
jgi:transposase InsO family protein